MMDVRCKEFLFSMSHNRHSKLPTSWSETFANLFRSNFVETLKQAFCCSECFPNVSNVIVSRML